MDQSGAAQARNRYVRVATLAAAADYAPYILSVMLARLPALAHFLLKPSALQPGADAKASVQLSGETA